MKQALQSHQFWVAGLTLLALVCASFVPGFKLDLEHSAGLAVIVAGYLVAYSINPTGNALVQFITSRRFWVSLLGFIVVILDAFHVFPAPLDFASMAGFVVIVAAYAIAVAADPGNGWRGLLVSRKFWSALVGIVVIFLNAFKIGLPAGLSPEQIIGIVIVLTGGIAAIGVQGVTDPILPEFNDDGNDG